MSEAIAGLISTLSDGGRAWTIEELLATNGVGLKTPGMYSWWVDSAGAADLTKGLGHGVEVGLIYAGQAGATRLKSGKKSSNTVWSRIKTMHLGKNHNLSTLRLALGSVLAEARGEQGVNEVQLTAWMMEHLRVVAVAGLDPDLLEGIETEVLRALDPPLNLAKVDTKRPSRVRLSELRRVHK